MQVKPCPGRTVAPHIKHSAERFENVSKPNQARILEKYPIVHSIISSPETTTKSGIGQTGRDAQALALALALTRA